VGPLDTPSNLADQLTSRGFEKDTSTIAMILDDFDIPFNVNSDVEVVAVSKETALENVDVLADMYGMGLSGEVMKVAMHAYINNQFYFVYPNGSSTPVAFTNMIYIDPAWCCLEVPPHILIGEAKTCIKQW
jgi:hypothetical protein